MRCHKKILIIWFIIIIIVPLLSSYSYVFGGCQQVSIEFLSSDDPKVEKIKTVYDNIAHAFGEGRIPPKLFVRPNNAKKNDLQIAAYCQSTERLLRRDDYEIREAYITIDERVYDLLYSLGNDFENALAVLLAHELAHYYKRHGWVREFGNAFADLTVGDGMIKTADYEEAIKIETEADYFGGFYSYIAGYDTLGIAPRVMDILYKDYKLPDELDGYPSLSERKIIVTRAKENLKNKIPIFETGNKMLLLEKYEEAGLLFGYLSQIFPSREIFNNAGVARALEAMSLSTENASHFAYPFEIDAETRLRNNAMREMKEKGGKGPLEDTEERRNKLLQRASEDFEKSINIDKNYAVGYINLASVYDLLGKHEDALFYVNKGKKIAKENGEGITLANAFIVSGIINATNGSKDKAISDFEAAQANNKTLALLNMAILNNTDLNATGFEENEIDLDVDISAIIEKTSSVKRETIGGITPKDLSALNVFDVKFSISDQTKSNPEIKIMIKKKEDWDATVVKIDKELISILSTLKGYKEESAKGIKVGSSLPEIKEKYGESTQIVSARRGNYYIYRDAKIIFKLNPDNAVEGWMIYEIK